MMKFKKGAIPHPSPGAPGGRPKQVVPDQSLSLKDILNRFVRKEALEVGHPSQYGSDGEIDPESDSQFNIDQEKAKHWDLTEKAEFREAVMIEREKFTKAEKAKAAQAAADKAKADKLADEKRIRIAAKKYAKNNPGNQGSI